MNLRNLNQDPLENLYSIIRQHGAFNTDPTAIQFAAALKTAIINSMTSKSSSSICEEDGSEFLTDLNNFLSASGSKGSVSKSSEGESKENVYVKHRQIDNNETKLVQHYSSQRQSYAYISGFIIKVSFREIAQFAMIGLLRSISLSIMYLFRRKSIVIIRIAYTTPIGG